MTSSDDVTNTEIQTFSGHMFDVFNPDKQKIELRDIAHALSMLCRYGGHAHQFYSVAEHSVLMSDYFNDRGEYDLARAALLHDATEAYMGDVVRPLKSKFPLYRQVESALQWRIFDKFGLAWEIPAEVKDADLRICNDERAVLLDNRAWVIDALPPLGVQLQCWAPIEAQQEWTDSFYQLFG